MILDLSLKFPSFFIRLLWIKNINDAIYICRRQRLITSMFRAPELSKYLHAIKTI